MLEICRTLRIKGECDNEGRNGVLENQRGGKASWTVPLFEILRGTSVSFLDCAICACLFYVY
jgi:hypothetical protein